MTKSGHLWAIGYDDMVPADQVRDEITRLGWDNKYARQIGQTLEKG
jgi:hypothetical protein